MNPYLKQFLIEEEGRKAQPYYDSRGYVTGGIGCLLDPRLPCPLPEDVIDLLFEHRSAEKEAQANTIPGFSKLNPIQQAMVISMVFQMGFEPFDGDGHLDFRDFLAALARGDIKAAVAAGLDSKWANKDSPARAARTMKILGSGTWVPKG